MRSSSFSLALLVAVLAPSATAQHRRARSRSRRAARAKRLEAIRAEMEKGQGLYVTGNYAGAAAIFEAGYATYPYSAFLFNAGVCYQKLNDVDRALAKFKEYAKVDPNAPDIDKVNQRIAALEAAKAAALAAARRRNTGRYGCRRGRRGAAARAAPPSRRSVLPSSDDQTAMKSVVVIETEPDGAPLRITAAPIPTLNRSRSARPTRVGKRSWPRARLQASPLMSVTITWSSRNSATSTRAKRT